MANEKMYVLKLNKAEKETIMSALLVAGATARTQAHIHSARPELATKLKAEGAIYDKLLLAVRARLGDA